MTAPPRKDTSALVDAARHGDDRSTGRLVSLVELGTIRPADLGPRPPTTRLVGITGPPGAGKSTLAGALIGAERDRGARVAVVAVDPSSPLTGGALLGDRIRMRAHFLDPGVFIRSMASRGHLGGLAARTPDVLEALCRCGFDVVILETVGVGQAEVEIASCTDTVVVLATAGGGDAVQIAKAGLLEIGDVFVVNKSDRPGASEVVAELHEMLALGEHDPGDFVPPVLELSAHRSGDGAILAAAIDGHREWLERSGRLEDRRVVASVARIQSLVAAIAQQRASALEDGMVLKSLAAQVASGSLDANAAAATLLDDALKRSRPD